MALNALPQDIVLLLCQELAFRRDFPTLFRCSLVSRRVASIALEQLYSIHELAPVSTDDTYNKKERARLWKSLILSSIGETALPYCTYVHSLSLGNYESVLEDISRDEYVRSWMFDAGKNVDQFLVLRDGYSNNSKRTRKHALAPVDYHGSMVKAGDSITKRIKEVADQTETAVALAHLEAYHIPVDILPAWITRLSNLISLRVRDGSVLTVEAASAISHCCPNFSELTCHYCRSTSLDEDMATFLQTLRPNSLRRFEVISFNDVGELTLTALNSHAESLKILKLGSMSAQAMKSLNVLPQCTALESLSIENRQHERVDLTTYSEGYLKEVTAWIQNCNNLQDLDLTNVLDALVIVKDVLNTPATRLTTLKLEGFQAQDAAQASTTWEALGLQDSLESLTLGGLNNIDGISVHESPPLGTSICKMKKLTTLNLTKANVSIFSVRQFTAALHNLEDLSFGGEWMDDKVLEHLSTLKYLKKLMINANSIFSWIALQRFALKLDSADHSGFSFDILSQLGEYKLTIDEESWLSDYFTNTMKGRFDIGYIQDPDELHESDFSTTSD